MRTMTITGAKGGVGTSTIACAVALTLAKQGSNVSLRTSNEYGSTAELAAMLGMTTPVVTDSGEGRWTEVGDTSLTLTSGFLSRVPQACEWDIIDNDAKRPIDAAVRVLVVRNDYGSLQRATTWWKHRYTHLVLVREPHRALDKRDIIAATGHEGLTIIEHDPAIARAIDAGLLTARLPVQLNLATDVLLSRPGVRA